jgi:hypothetical protein
VSVNLDVLGQLDEGDLDRYRRAMAKRKLAEMGHPGLGVEECIEAQVDYDRTMQYIMDKYGIEPGQCPLVSSVDGVIAERI